MKLSPRLQAIADWIDRGARLADIGTDHGLLPIYCVMKGITAYTAACDIRERPLQSARNNAAAYGVEDRIEFILSSGLEHVEEGSVDTIAAAGMGGETIVSILSGADWIRNKNMTLLLQPQSKAEDLRHWLDENGFYADRAQLVRDSGRLYLVLRVRWDGGRRRTDPFWLGLLSGDELLGAYAAGLLRRCEKQLLAFRDETDDPAGRKELTELMTRLKCLTEEISGSGRNDDDDCQ